MAPSPTIRRLLRECAELSPSSNNPSPAFHAAPVTDADLHEWHFTLLGPPSPSPYAGGLYHGRITLPPSYPLKPPNFRFLTPSGRFEVNREICLSISGFHEETWMPAWGVRTALTALRTFMAEPGTAGQVGGLESSDEVRKRLAHESKAWRCSSCGKSNDSVMREWWQSCRDKGVKVDEETEMGLEVLPEGMNVEARSPQSIRKDTPEPDPKVVITAAPESPVRESSSADQRDLRNPIPIRQSSSNLDPNLLRDNIFATPSPSAESVQASAEARLVPADLQSRDDAGNAGSAGRHATRPIMNVHAPPIAAAIATQQQELQPHLTIDRAIAGVFFALCLMVLKKMFYPAGTRDLDDFYLQREL